MDLRKVSQLADKLTRSDEPMACLVVDSEVFAMAAADHKLQRMLADYGLAILVGVYQKGDTFDALQLALDLRQTGIEL